MAAVADYTPARRAPQKIKKGLPGQTLELVGTADILAEVADLDPRPFTVGFAAETEKLRAHAREKLSRKRLDMIAANRVGQPGTGFESEENEILLLSADAEKPLGRGSKTALAAALIEEVARRLEDTGRIETDTD